MKAVRVVPTPQGGKVEVQDIPVPEVGAGQVLVRVRAAGLNRGEINQARELRSGNTITAGVELAGEVAQVGEGVKDWREGDRVMGHGKGCQAEYVIMDPLALMPVPENLSWVDAAAFPNVFITAHDAVVTNGELRKGESILVNGASGGVAMAAIQIASLLGAKPVIATSRSAAKLDKLSQFGVDVGIDSSRESQLEVVMAATDKRGVDVIIDTVGGPVFEANMDSLAVKGRLVNIARLGSATAQIDLAKLWLKRLKLIGVTFRTRTEQERLECVQACARDLLPFLEAGRIRLPIDRTFAIDEIADAHAYMQLDQHVGKIVLTLA
ncbi:Phthiocerol synthesis polyketide synthase type I PpsC [Paraburkholderia domus]|uniref:Phthiocerol synthesis polyketide synthase type I PpsC n=1 Tax=Paraburkholderia domus TaxID=2793075 RepID=A0A9N8R2U1_9BURK|nr:zinc-binding dehydrogenase [Paraburkholderia domus]MBK5053146.1 zinc-binding dehydrogenase [Burkholderia sp. R-70006]MBK5065063.1 zinc-binding dehydrogenase [Burkholderia sp. R-70199]MBK5090237.1 zinc-binding dehydrogenase [Burkholderia sp. R-69927]MBK5124774.1 zinc-binding dehydrogenase [Burkholderia sp. R-69980]MBK5169024.1 zinc-binding dehydrogenase [Burkholderia sp. R-70211]MBK5184229.1 zinc-binding dehydrogenase [Burkholderia sp. R-69749]MCI0150580.1 zinc-binding dehydrogenase [Parab